MTLKERVHFAVHFELVLWKRNELLACICMNHALESS